jgi:hypothetical protein
MNIDYVSFIVLFVVLALIVVLWRRNEGSKPALSLRVAAVLSALSAMLFTAQALGWAVGAIVTPGQQIPIKLVTAIDSASRLTANEWSTLVEIARSGSATLSMNLMTPREFLVSGLDGGTVFALIAVEVISALVAAYLSWLAFRACRTVLDGESFTDALLQSLRPAPVVIAVAVMIREGFRITATNDLYGTFAQGSVAISSIETDLSLLWVGLGIAAFSHLVRAGRDLQRDTAGLV